MRLPSEYDFNDCFDIGGVMGLGLFIVISLSIAFGWAVLKVFLAIAAVLGLGFLFVLGGAWLFAFVVINYEDWEDKRAARKYHERDRR